jgi:hypothetical protein
MRKNPRLYEINASIFLRRVSRKHGSRLALAAIPDAEWQSLARQGFDLVWLMGVWQRSTVAREQAQCNIIMRRRYNDALPECSDVDIDGSSYAINGYQLDAQLGQPADLALIKTNIHNQGLGLMLDFIPNHLARDNPWLASHPEWFVQGSKAALHQHPDWFFSPDGKTFFAHGRDPYFPPWGDTAQINFFSRELRQAMTAELLKIARLADGVRCDMAMLALNDVFQQVWGDTIKGYPRPQTEFWTELIEAVKKQYPDFIFLAEAYWGLEPRLLNLGFDFVYDKTFYDRLRYSSAADIRNYLATADIPLEQGMHFIENHDEPRAPVIFGRERSLAMAVAMATIPGLCLFHDGQFEGKRIHMPVQLVREPEEAIDLEVRQFYHKLLEITAAPAFHDREWKLLETAPAWPGNGTDRDLLTWCWYSGNRLKIVAINYVPHQSQGRLKLPVQLKTGQRVDYHDELTGAEYGGNPDEINRLGLYVDLGPWRCHILNMLID